MSVETNGTGLTGNLPGLYRHPESGAEIVVTRDARLGSAMADGAVQTGFRYVGPAPVEAPVVKTEEAVVTDAPKAESQVKK